MDSRQRSCESLPQHNFNREESLRLHTQCLPIFYFLYLLQENLFNIKHTRISKVFKVRHDRQRVIDPYQNIELIKI